jgi:hypothetical protein
VLTLHDRQKELAVYFPPKLNLTDVSLNKITSQIIGQSDIVNNLKEHSKMNTA